MNNLRFMSMTLLISSCMISSSASASDFFDTGRPERFITIGARIGVNTSNMTSGGKDIFNVWDKNSWGTGFDLGVVTDLHIRNFISIQPGIFFQSRSGDFTYTSSFMVPVQGENGSTSLEEQQMVQYGHNRNYNLVIPIVASAHFNMGSKVKWNVDFGPYVNFRMGNSGRPSVYEIRYNNMAPVLHDSEAQSKTVDFGFKMGTGFTFFRHYYVGVHYMAGSLDVWKTKGMGGRNKAWTFTAGYDF